MTNRRERKSRGPIPTDVSAEVLFSADRTCCKCRVHGKRVQIHHIDENPSNNDLLNLAVLCFDCHDETLLAGGFGRRLDAAQVRQFRDDWTDRVQRRRDEADRLAASVMSPSQAPGVPQPATAGVGIIGHPPVVSIRSRPLLSVEHYVATLPELRRRAYERAQPDWDTGVTATVVEACYRIITVLEEVLATLATYFPAGHFDHEKPRDYISELISTRSRWHYYHAEPHGHGEDGTIVHVLVARAVLSDVERMIAEMVHSLTLDWEGSGPFNFDQWDSDWFNPKPIGEYGLKRQVALADTKPTIKWGCYQFAGDERL